MRNKVRIQINAYASDERNQKFIRIFKSKQSLKDSDVTILYSFDRFIYLKHIEAVKLLCFVSINSFNIFNKKYTMKNIS